MLVIKCDWVRQSLHCSEVGGEVLVILMNQYMFLSVYIEKREFVVVQHYSIFVTTTIDKIRILSVFENSTED
jgi:hypothetical protein